MLVSLKINLSLLIVLQQIMLHPVLVISAFLNHIKVKIRSLLAMVGFKIIGLNKRRQLVRVRENQKSIKYNKYKGGSNRKQSNLDWIQCYHLSGTIKKSINMTDKKYALIVPMRTMVKISAGLIKREQES